MEDILEIYGSECPENTARLCFDERPCQLIEQVYTPMKMEPGNPNVMIVNMNEMAPVVY